MIVYQGGIEIKLKPLILSLGLIGGWVYTIVLFDLYAIVMSVANLNFLDKNTKGGNDHYYHLGKDGKMFLLII